VVLNALRLTGFNPEKKLQKIRKNNKNIIKSNKISKNISVKTKKSKNKKKENIKMKTIVVVGGMMCKNCERHVTEALGAVKGVDEVLVDLNSGNVTLYSAKKLDDNQLKTAVEDAGYTVIKIAHND
jgi:copper chaperone CopZ